MQSIKRQGQKTMADNNKGVLETDTQILNPLTDINWRDMWIQRDNLRKDPDDSSYWDSRAKEFGSYHRCKETSSYAKSFIAYLAPQANETILDIGCGNGGVAIPLARQGHKVTALDFSAKMLEVLNEHCCEEGITQITAKQLSWTDDWQASGIAAKSVDIAFASRSTMVHDLWDAIERLCNVAKRRVAMTLATRFGPRCTYELGQTVDGIAYVPDHIYAINMLFQMGYTPELRYIDSYKRIPSADRATPEEQSCSEVAGMTKLAGALNATDISETPESLDISNVEKCPTASIVKKCHVISDTLESKRLVRWAHIAWDL